MAERRHLPPQIRRVELAQRAGHKPVVRDQLTVDTGIVDGNGLGEHLCDWPEI